MDKTFSEVPNYINCLAMVPQTDFSVLGTAAKVILIIDVLDNSATARVEDLSGETTQDFPNIMVQLSRS